MCSTWRVDLAALQKENERLQALLVETEMALATSEEARRRLEVIVGQLRHEKFGARSEKLHPDQHHLPLEDVEIAQGVLDAAQEKAARIIKGRSDSRPGAPQRNRGRLPAHLPRVEQIIEPKSRLCPCGPVGSATDGRSHTGTDMLEMLSSVDEYSPIVGIENSLVGIPA